MAGDVALEAASDLGWFFAFCGASGGVGAGLGVVAEPAEDNGVECLVELPVAVAVEAVSGDEPGGRLDGGDPGKVRERGFVSESAYVRSLFGPPRPGGRGASEVLGGGGAGRKLVVPEGRPVACGTCRRCQVPCWGKPRSTPRWMGSGQREMTTFWRV